MKSIKQYQKAYFLGIGGIGMSAIARYFNHIGMQVYGYDKTPTPLTNRLEEEGIQIHYTDQPDLLTNFQLSTENTLVVLTPAIPKDHLEWHWFRTQGFSILKRSEVLGLLSKSYNTIGIAGTHGKTTTSTLLAHLLKQSHLDCAACLGGISVNYQSNLILPTPQHNVTNLMVVEADEFDRSFLTLYPQLAVITSTDADHLDIYGEHSAFKSTFISYANQVHVNGTLFVKYGLDIVSELNRNFHTYGFSEQADVYAYNIRISGDSNLFDLNYFGTRIQDLSLGIPGMHNIENAIAASAISLKLGMSEFELRNGLSSFKGVKRRFEYIVKNDEHVFIDDYAHHPEEIKAILNSVRAMYPTKKMYVAFQPHLFSRTRDFMPEFAKALSLADCLYLLDIYPARELPIEGVNSQNLLNEIQVEQKYLLSKNDLVEKVVNEQPELFVLLGAGDIDTLIQPIKDRL
jgi:UDP-N-acetylmuramate--alanine ligase